MECQSCNECYSERIFGNGAEPRLQSGAGMSNKKTNAG